MVVRPAGIRPPIPTDMIQPQSMPYLMGRNDHSRVEIWHLAEGYLDYPTVPHTPSTHPNGIRAIGIVFIGGSHADNLHSV